MTPNDSAFSRARYLAATPLAALVRSGVGPLSLRDYGSCSKRPADGGRGLEGVIVKADGYFNPASEILENSQPGSSAGVPAQAGQLGSPR